MNLRKVFIANLKKFRKERRLSQMKFAEYCDTAASYIGEIEIGRKFPSIEMIEKFAKVLEIEPYRLFVNETVYREKSAAALKKLSPEARQNLANALALTVTETVADAILRTLG
jgi:transcriptional regulator with XRE-family HTH domain